MSSKKRYSHSETRKEEHLRLLDELEQLTLSDSCCELCHCDCYSSHRSSEGSGTALEEQPQQRRGRRKAEERPIQLEEIRTNGAITASGPTPMPTTQRPDGNNNKDNASTSHKRKVKVKRRKSASKARHCNTPASPPPTTTKSKSTSASPLPAERRAKSTLFKRRSKSANSLRSSGQLSELSTYYTRDCRILQELLTSFEDKPQLEITGRGKTHTRTSNKTLPAQQPWPSLNDAGLEQTQSLQDDVNVNANANYDDEQPMCSKDAAAATASATSSLGPLKLCDSMANLCLAPVVRQAFKQVPTHDKRILNRMATKRSEQALAKENAWLARKFWENERYERELLKCEQMEEYKLAVRDKQFQDYLLTKARLNEIAQRDLAELQRLRASLQQKDERTKRRLASIRVERDILLCQRRCDELRKSEAVNVQQEEQHLDETLRKHSICQRLSERLQRADIVRTQMLDSYLKRLRYDNYIEQLLHEEKWREAQQFELHKREELKQHISRKRTQSQRFVETRQRRNETLAKTAKISASLRELVRSSVTPEAGVAAAAVASSSGTLAGGGAITLGKLLFDRTLPKLPLP